VSDRGCAYSGLSTGCLLLLVWVGGAPTLRWLPVVSPSLTPSLSAGLYLWMHRDKPTTAVVNPTSVNWNPAEMIPPRAVRNANRKPPRRGSSWTRALKTSYISEPRRWPTLRARATPAARSAASCCAAVAAAPSGSRNGLIDWAVIRIAGRLLALLF